MTKREELMDFMRDAFPGMRMEIEAVGDLGATLRHPIGPGDLRPGGTVAGPVLMTVADAAIYIAILGEIGLVALAVTTSLHVSFLRKPRADRDVIGVCRLLKLGRTLAVGEVSLYSEGEDEPVAHAVGSYAIPR